MANRVHAETIEIRNQILADLERIYDSEWHEIEPELNRLVEAIYLDQEEATQNDRLKHAEKDGKKNRLIELIVIASVLANLKAIKYINSGMDKVYKINANDVTDHIHAKTKIKIFEKGIDIKKLLSEYTKRRYDSATDKQYISDEILKEINKMLKAGDGTKKISQRLQKVYGFNKTSADRITLTETTRIQSRGRIDIMNEAARRGMKFKKIWRHGIHVNMPRDWHVKLNEVAVDLDKAFNVDGIKMDCPGDPRGGAVNNINCHCWLDEELVSWNTSN